MKSAIAVCLVLGAVGAGARTTPCAVFEALAKDALQKQQRFTKTALGDTVAYTLASSGDSKHTPYMVVADGVATVTVGEGTVTGNPDHKIHPTSAAGDPGSVHYIERMYAKDQDGHVIAMAELTASTAQPSLVFEIPAGTTSIVPYSLCNKHGLYEGAATAVAAGDARGVATCVMSRCGENTVGVVDGVCGQFAAMAANAQREQLAMFNTTEAFAPSATNTKHTPYVAVLGSSVRVTVGRGTVTHTEGDLIHPTGAPADWPASAIHYISMLYVKNQDGVVVAAGQLVPEGQPSLEFEIPAGTTSLTAYSLCNTHGLFVGYTVAVAAPAAADAGAGAGADTALVACGLSMCGGHATGRSRCMMLEAFHADAVRKHGNQVGADVAVYTPTATNTKHTPYVTLAHDGATTTATVTVGLGTVSGNADDPIHPTDGAKPHFIELVYAKDQDGRVIAMTQLTATEAGRPTLVFDVPAGVTAIVPYSLCNIHGLYEGAATVLATGSNAGMACGLTGACEDAAAAGASCAQFEALTVESERLQLAHFKEAAPYAPSETNTKHTPYVTISGTRGRVTVGLGTVTGSAGDAVHKNGLSGDAATIHFIDQLYVRNQDGVVIAMTKLAPVDELPALEFDIPAGTTSVVAYSHCNKHGLYMSATYEVAEGSRGAGAATCVLAGCGGAGTGRGGCALFDALRADSLRVHALAHGGSTTPFPPSGDDVHTPAVAVSGAEAVVTVPGFTAVASARAGEVRFIRRLYAEDQHGAVVAMAELAGAAPAELRFAVPTGVTQLTAYAARNTGGITASAAVAVARTSGSPRVCEVSACNVDTASAGGRCVVFENLAAQAWLQHEQLLGETTARQPEEKYAKHTPFLVLEGSFGTVTVGAGTVGDGPVHPGGNGNAAAALVHYIETMWVENQDGVVVALVSLGPEDTPALRFEVPAGTTSLTPFSWCNKHGLYEGAATAVAARHVSAAAAGIRCGTQRCGGAATAATVCPTFEALAADALRQHAVYLGADAAVPAPDANPKHTPYVTVLGGEARVVVGVGVVSNTPDDPVHIGRVTTDPALVHQIVRVWATNQDGVVVAMANLPATVGDAPSLTFTVPRGTTSITGHHLCQPHGVFRSRPVAVDVDARGRLPVRGGAGAPERGCGVTECVVDPVGYDAGTGTCQAFELVKTQMLDQHKDLTGSDAPVTAVSDETPVLTVAAGVGRVALGAAALARRNPTGDAGRYVEFDTVWVENEAGRVVAAGRVKPFEAFDFTFAFANTTQTLTPFVFSTATGVQAGAAVALGAAPACFTQGCRADDVAAADDACFFRTLRAECERRHALIRPGMAGPFPAGNDTKHQPYVTLAGATATVTVGLGTVSGNPDDKVHPTVATGDAARLHFIERLYVVDQNDVVIAFTELAAATERPSLTFTVPAGTTAVTAYSLCNTHGLYVSEVYAVTETGADAARCAMTCAADTAGVVDGACLQHTVLETLSRQMHLAYFAETAPYTEAKSVKHTPYLTVKGAKGKVSVGRGLVSGDAADPIHYNTEGGDVSKVHFIELLYVKDQDGLVVAMARLQGQQNEFEFAVPPTATSLTAYSHCNKHGLYVGPTTAVEPTICTLQSCVGEQTTSFATGVVAGPSPATPATDAPKGCTVSDLEGFACMVDVGLPGATLHWSWDGASPTMQMAVRSESVGWLGIAFTESFGSMVPADSVVFSGQGVQTYRLTQQGQEGVTLDAGISDRIGLAEASGATDGGFTVLRFTRLSAGFDALSGINVARDMSNSLFQEHRYDQMSPMILSLSGAGEVVTVKLEDLQVYRKAHGWLMLLSWIYLAPLGVLLKRYGKPIFGLGNSIKPSVGLGHAFIAHLVLVFAVIASVISAFALAQSKFKSNSEPDPDKHNTIGYFIFAFMCFMPFVGVLMPLFAPARGELGRAQLKFVHANLGRCLVILAYAQVFSGIEKLKKFKTEGADEMQVVSIVGVAGFAFLFFAFELVYRNYRVLPRGPEQAIENIDRISWAEVREHTSMEEPWVVVDGRVYNVAAWLYTHPGGPQVLMGYAGGDGTDDFKNVGHSAGAKKRMEKFYIGDLEDNRMVTAEDVAEEVTSALVCLRLQYAEEALQVNKELVPAKLHEAFSQLVKNLETYLPFLPPSLVAEVHDEVDGVDEEEESSHAQTARTGKSAPNGAASPSGGSATTARTSRRGSMMSRRLSAATSVAQAKQAQSVAARQNGVKPQKITMMYVTAHFFETLDTCDLAAFVKYHEFFLTTVIENTTSQRGVVDSFVGNRAVTVWNAFRPSMTHSQKCLHAMKGFMADAARFQSMMTCTAVAASGLATLGLMGTSEMRRPTIMGPVLDVVQALERYAALGGYISLCNVACYENAKLEHKMKMIMDRVHIEGLQWRADPRQMALDSAPKHLCDAAKNAGDVPEPPKGEQSRAGQPTLVYEVVIEAANGGDDEVEDDEWMYQLEGAACREWEEYNEAGRMALYMGQAEAAVSHLQDTDAEKVSGFKDALAAGCVVDFRTKVANSKGEQLPAHALAVAHREGAMMSVHEVLSDGGAA